jgi:hypothetical protein
VYPHWTGPSPERHESSLSWGRSEEGIADLYLEKRLRVVRRVHHWSLSKQLMQPKKNPKVAGKEEPTVRVCLV